MITDGQFPAPIRLTMNPNAQWTRKAWVKGEIEEWVAARIAARDAGVVSEATRRPLDPAA